MKTDLEWEEIRKLAKEHLCAYAAAVDSRTDTSSASRLSEIRKAIATEGFWKQSDEWRISTWTETSIERLESEKSKYRVTVECDGQTFRCECPVLWRAVLFADLYAHLISQIFYDIAPPWAGESHGYVEFDPRQETRKK